MPAELQTYRHNATLVLTLCGSGASSLFQSDIHAAVIETLSTAESDRSLAAVVLAGLENFSPAEGKPFSLPPGSEALLENLNDWVQAIRAFPKPVIAAVEGQLAGPVLPLGLACDLVVAGQSSSFRVTSPIAGGVTWFLAQDMPRQLAMEMLTSPTPLPATRLHAMGLVNRLADDHTARDCALDWADQLASHAMHAEGIKTLLQDARHHSLAQQIAAEARHRLENRPGL